MATSVVVVAVADEPHGAREVVIEVLAPPGQPGQPIEDGEVAGVSLDIDRVRCDVPLERWGLATTPEAVMTRAALRRTRRARIGRVDLGGREEPLEVAQPVASIASWIDPVVAQPTRIAPGPDRVRVHAEQACRLGHGKGRVGRSGGKCGRHGSWRKCELGPSSLPFSQFLPIVRWSRPPVQGSGAATARELDVRERAERRDEADRRRRPGSRTPDRP